MEQLIDNRGPKFDLTDGLKPKSNPNKSTLRQLDDWKKVSDLYRYLPGGPNGRKKPLGEIGGANWGLGPKDLIRCPQCNGRYTFEKVKVSPENMALFWYWKCEAPECLRVWDGHWQKIRLPGGETIK